MSYQQPTTMSEANYTGGRAPSNYGQPAIHARPTRDPQAENAMTNLVHTFTNTNVGIPGSSTMQTAAGVGANQFAHMTGGHYFYTHEGQLVYAPGPFQTQPIAPAQVQVPETNYTPFAAPMQFMPQASYPGFMPGFPMVPYATGRGYYGERQDSMNLKHEVPGLENRRGSYSTNESAPGTPFYGSVSSRDHGANVAVIDRSPIFTTPSPNTITHTHLLGAQAVKPLQYKTASINNVELDALLSKHPAIPHAVPAVFTPRENMRTLEQSLSNPMQGNRNVYIRGLHPHTDDDTLAAYASRFGKVETSKAIIDTSTGACKGFGFAKYVDVRDSENCIRGFYKLGYEVGFARESFNARLKAEGDEASTNLYVSNLPKSMTEAELGAVFIDYKVSSSRILRDSQGNSRGVGFARFESRDICEEVVKKFHGQPIGEEGLLLQVRYADTPQQKELKRVTTERRQFRTTEYNVGAYGTVADVIALSPTITASPILPNRMAQIARHIPATRMASSAWKRDNYYSSASSSGSAGGVHFKDVDRSYKAPQVQSSGSKDIEPSASTPTVSEDGSNDEVTIHCESPIVAVGGSDASPAAKTA